MKIYISIPSWQNKRVLTELRKRTGVLVAEIKRFNQDK